MQSNFKTQTNHVMTSEKEESGNLDITETLGKTELFIEKNQKNLTIALGVIVLVVGGYFGYKKFVLEPKEKEAQAQMFVAERYFEMDSLKLAINGDGNYKGFEAIVSDYGMTKSANRAHYYLGMSYLKTGEYEKAIENLKNFSSDDEVLKPIAMGAIGDAYMEQGKMDEAAAQYKLAAEAKTNDFSSPIYLMKAGLAFEKAGKFDEAVAVYEKVKSDFPKSNEAANTDKFIERAKASKK